MPSNLFTIIHTDGGCSPNPGEGAYVAILQNGERTACVRGYAPYATNQQMELAAAIAGLQALKSTKIPVHLYTDSQYLQAGASMWIKGWRNNGWKNSEDKPLANVELWQELNRVMSKYVIAWFKVEGHAGVQMNVKADNLVWDTRNAKGDPNLYQVTEIPALESTWDYNQFQHEVAQRGQQVNHTVRPEVAALRAQFGKLLQRTQRAESGPQTKWPVEARPKGPQ